ncbi:MAG: enoyl-CoA hydratase/isomerase family protein, partial [Mycobacterium sp.]|nr:enoyl-CoA hydratase/isomerase family protein [Mycobacterium sp.]
LELPVIAAVQGVALGGGLGLACAADFRVVSPETRFEANFSRLAFHHGFALSVTLPRIVRNQHAAFMLDSAAEVRGEQGESKRIEEAWLIASSPTLTYGSRRSILRRRLSARERQVPAFVGR